MISVMGCQGSEVQILSCRPKFPKKQQVEKLAVFFILQTRREFPSSLRSLNACFVSDQHGRPKAEQT